MSAIYDEYIKEHKNNVGRAFKWLSSHVPAIFKNDDPQFCAKVEHNCLYSHDESKLSQDEYIAYDNYFYGNRSYEVVKMFNYAWLHHIHNNPHHWQYWILNNDDPDQGEVILDMPDEYIIEMICDWWSFSWKKGDLYEIFKWYDERKDHIKLSDVTRRKVETTLAFIHNELDAAGDEINV